jgi:hypothetical protein
MRRAVSMPSISGIRTSSRTRFRIQRSGHVDGFAPGACLPDLLEPRSVGDQLARGAQKDQLVVDGKDGDRYRVGAAGRRIVAGSPGSFHVRHVVA